MLSDIKRKCHTCKNTLKDRGEPVCTELKGIISHRKMIIL